MQPTQGKMVFFFLYRNISVIDSSICKAFEHVPREVIWLTLKKKGIVLTITEIYKNIFP